MIRRLLVTTLAALALVPLAGCDKTADKPAAKAAAGPTAATLTTAIGGAPDMTTGRASSAASA